MGVGGGVPKATGSNEANAVALSILLASGEVLGEYSAAALTATVSILSPLLLITLSGDTRHDSYTENPVMPFLHTASRGNVWTPNSDTGPNNENYFNDGQGIPSWLR